MQFFGFFPISTKENEGDNVAVKISINPRKVFQTMQGFGVSGAWWAQYVGGVTQTDPESGKSVRDRISELLFSKENGLGIQIYRFNVGAGSADSGNGNIENKLRRTECFEVSPGKYDWSKDKNAVYMMKKAVEDGVDEVILFFNSPPERLTKNGKAHLDKIFFENISRKNYAEFARFGADTASHFVSEGVPVKYISPVNEPIWIWTGGQEGCHYHPWNMKPVFKAFALELDKRPELKDIMLSGPESGDLRFFNKSYIRSMLSEPTVRRRMDCIDTHSYCAQINIPLIKKPLNNRAAFVKRYGKWVQKKYPDMAVKMSEWTHMQGGRDSGMASALEQAKIMTEDIGLMNAASWQHWIAVSEVDYCDGLIYINIPENTFEITKRYYAFGNFTKFVPIGAKRIEAQCGDSDLSVLAFDCGEYTAVIAVNFSESPKSCDFGADGGKTVTTDETHNLAETEYASLSDVVIPPRSINTVII